MRSRFRHWLRWLLDRRRMEDDLAEELRFHIEEETRHLIEAGHSGEEARRLARLRFGPVDGAREEVRRAHGVAWLDDLRRDVRLAVRGIARRPGLGIAVVATLGLGLGASLGTFGLARALLRPPAGVGEPDRLVFVWGRTADDAARRRVAGADAARVRSLPELADVAFLAGVSDASLPVAGAAARPARLATVTPNWFEVLGVRMAAGRSFAPEEGGVPAFVISEALARAHFGTAAAVGRTLEVSGRTGTVVGVLSAEFAFRAPPELEVPDRLDIWAPLGVALDALGRPDRLRDQDSDDTGIVVGRLRSDGSVAGLQSGLDALGTRLRAEVPAYAVRQLAFEARTYATDTVAHVRPMVLTVGLAAGLILLLAIANATGLLLTRGLARSREVAVQSALGAGRGRIVRQTLTENAVLVVCGLVPGAALAAVAANSLGRVSGMAVRLDGGMVAMVVGLVAVVATLTSVVVLGDPVLRDAGTLRTRAVGGGARRLRDALVALQVALSIALLGGAGLMLRSAHALARADLGFRPANVLAFRIGLTFPDRYRGPADRAALVRLLEERIGGLPDIAAVGVVGGLPLADPEFVQPWARPGAAEWSGRANFRVVTAGYFDALGIRILAGRGFRPEDDRQDRRVVLVDERLAAHIAPRGSATGRTIRVPIDGAAVDATIVGIVENVRYETATAAGRETVYVPYRHEASRNLAVVVRGTEAPPAAPDIARAMAGADAGIAMHDARLLSTVVAAATDPPRILSRALLAFGAAGLLLAIVGLHGAIAWTVARRTAEIGLRRALGASPRRVVHEILRTGLVPIALGLGMGTVLLVAGSVGMRALVYGVSPLDPLTLGGAAAVVAAVCTGTAVLAAARAAAIEPRRALTEP